MSLAASGFRAVRGVKVRQSQIELEKHYVSAGREDLRNQYLLLPLFQILCLGGRPGPNVGGTLQPRTAVFVVPHHNDTVLSGVLCQSKESYSWVSGARLKQTL